MKRRQNITLSNCSTLQGNPISSIRWCVMLCHLYTLEYSDRRCLAEVLSQWPNDRRTKSLHLSAPTRTEQQIACGAKLQEPHPPCPASQITSIVSFESDSETRFTLPTWGKLIPLSNLSYHFCSCPAAIGWKFWEQHASDTYIYR